MSTAKFTRLLALFLSLFGLDFWLGNSAFQFFMNLPNSRAQEAEADHVGLLLAAGACYRPEESVHVWERFQKQEQAGQVPAFMSTHPTHSNRIESLKGKCLVCFLGAAVQGAYSLTSRLAGRSEAH